MKTVVLDGYSVNPGDLSWEPLKELGELTIYDRTENGQIVERAKDADMVLTNKAALTADIISALPRLKYIGVLATGFNIVDIEKARECGITVTNVPAYSTMSVTQMVFAHIFNIMNRVDYYACQNRRGKWSGCPDFVYWDLPLHELDGKTMGIVGLGNIGSKVAAIAHNFGMDVFALTSKNAAELPDGIRKTTLEGLLSVSDILTLHCPLTETTRGMINKENIGKMKRGAIIINTGRGSLVNEQDVAEALREGQLGAYGADVMCAEPPSADNPLFSVPNAYITPHIAWASCEARARLMDIAVANIKAFVNGTPVNVVNM